MIYWIREVNAKVWTPFLGDNSEITNGEAVKKMEKSKLSEEQAKTIEVLKKQLQEKDTLLDIATKEIASHVQDKLNATAEVQKFLEKCEEYERKISELQEEKNTDITELLKNYSKELDIFRQYENENLKLSELCSTKEIELLQLRETIGEINRKNEPNDSPSKRQCLVELVSDSEVPEMNQRKLT